MAAAALSMAAAAGTTYAGYSAWASFAYVGTNLLVSSFLREPNKTYGPRLTDLSVTSSGYGTTINKIYGTIRTNCNIIWSSGIQEIPHKKKVGGKGFGKKDTNTTYTYQTSLAFSICLNKTSALRKILADGENCYDNSKSNTGPTTSMKYSALRFYNGTSDQMPDPTIEAHEGVGKVPAHRGESYFVIDNLDLMKWNGSIPNFTVEIVGEVSQFDSIVEEDYIYVEENFKQFTAKFLFSNELQKVYGFGNQVEVYDCLSKTSVLKPRINGVNGLFTVLCGNMLFESEYKTGNSYGLNVFDDDYNLKYSLDPSKFSGFTSVPGGNFSQISGGIRTDLSTYTLFYLFNEYIAIVTISNFINNQFNSIKYVPITDRARFLDLITLNAYKKTTVAYDGKNYYFRKRNGTSTEIYKVSANQFDTNLVLETTILNTSIDGSLSNYIFSYDDISNSIITSMNDLENSSDLSSNQCIVRYSLSSKNVTERKNTKFFTGSTGIQGATQNPFYFDEGNLYAFARIFNAETSSYFDNMYKINTQNFNSFQIIRSKNISGNVNTYIGQLPTFFNSKLQYVFVQFSDARFNKLYLNRIIKRSYTAFEIIKAICADAGLDLNTIDVTDVQHIEIKGYAVTQGDLKKVLEQLCAIFDIEIIETNYKLIFRKSKRDISRVIDIKELGVQTYSENSNFNDLFNTTDTDELSLPRSITINYYDVDNNYVQTNQTDTKFDSLSKNIVNNEYPVVLNANEAKSIAQRLLDTAYVSRYNYEFSLNINHADLEAGDVIQIQNGTDRYTMKISKIEMDLCILKVSAVSYSNIIYSQYSVGSAGESIKVDNQIKITSPSSLYFLDLPLIGNDFTGVYASSAPRSAELNWRGSVLQISNDGANFDTKTSFSNPANVGNAISVLGNFSTKNEFDFFNYVTVQCREELENKTIEQILNGENTALLGEEIIQFMKAETVGTNVYKLSGLLRNRFQTVSNNHKQNEIFIMLDADEMRQLNLDISNVNQTLYYRNVSVGEQEDDTQINGQIWSGKTIRPMAIEIINYNLNPTNSNWNISWIPTLRGQNYIQNGSVPVDIDDSTYEIDFFNSNDVFIATRRISNDNKILYTREMQIADFGSAQARLYFKIYKTNGKFGRSIAKSVDTNLIY